MIVVAGRGGDARPARVSVLPRGAQRAMEAGELGERLWADAHGFMEHATEVPLAHAEVGGDGVHAGARQPVGGGEGELRAGGTALRGRQTIGDRALEDRGRSDDVARAGQPRAQSPRVNVAPQVLERNDAPGHRGGGHAEHRLRRAQRKARRQGPLPAANELSMHPLAGAERVDVEAASRRRAEADDELELWTGDRDAGAVAIAVADEQGRQSGRGRRARRNAVAMDGAGVHEASLIARAPSRNPPGTLVRFIQSPTSAGGYVRQMKILVTGATGKVGSRLAKRLAQRGDEVRALVRDPARAADLREAGIELAEGDLLKPESLTAAVRGLDAVVHCAAFFRGATPEQAQAVNDLGTQHLARAAQAASVKRFVFTSTGLVYGSNGGRLAEEDDACAPTAAYPVSKLAAERFLLAIEGFDVRVLRLPFVYGDGDPHIAEAIPMMRSFSPTQRMSVGHHADVAQAVARLLDAPSPAHRIYNVVDDEAPDFATLFASVGAPPPDGSNADAARAFDALLDGRRIREDLGFRPKFPRLADAMAAGA